MARPYTGKVSTRIREQKQKNGTIYVIEEKRQYNPEKKYTETIESKLLGMKLSNDGKVVNTRPRRSFINMTVNETDPVGKVTAVRKHVQMMDIVNHMADISGIDEDVYSSTDRPSAMKILSMARYIVCSDAHTLAGIEEWQYNHPLPYNDGINKGIYPMSFS